MSRRPHPPGCQRSRRTASYDQLVITPLLAIVNTRVTLDDLAKDGADRSVSRAVTAAASTRQQEQRERPAVGSLSGGAGRPKTIGKDSAPKARKTA